MKIELIYKDKEPIGWEMIPEIPEDDEIIAFIRDAIFFGFEETKIVYDGLTLKDPKQGKQLGNIASLKWKKKNFVE